MQDHLTEEWRLIPGSEGLYECSTQGRIRSVQSGVPTAGRQRGRVLKGTMNKKGYLWFRMEFLDGRHKQTTFHQAVALAFIGPSHGKIQVNHKDGNKENNRPENLEYVTCLENIRHCWDNGLHGVEHCQGEANNKAKLTEEKVRLIRSQQDTKTLRELADEHGVTPQAIWHIVKRKTWKHVA